MSATNIAHSGLDTEGSARLLRETPPSAAQSDVKGMDSRNTPGGQAVTIDEAIHRQRVNQRATAGKLFKMPKPTLAALNVAIHVAAAAIRLARTPCG